jgi:CAAX prenyl protease-like protein
MTTTREPAPTPATPAGPPRDPSADVWPYIAPMIGFVVLTSLEGQLPTAEGGAPSPVWYPLGYALKVAVVSALVWWARPTWRDLQPRPTPVGWLLSVVLGVLVIVAWVGLDGRYPELSWLGKRTAFDPAVMPPAARYGFLALRFFGLVALVPLIEEMFYRSFLMRWIVDPDFTKVPIGKVTAAGLGATTALFTFSHPEWLPALLTALAWGWLLHQTKSVSACVVSHAVANLVLGIYVLATGDWKFW